MARITLPDPQAMDPDQRRVYDKIVSGRRGRVQGPLRAALHNADLAERWQALGELLRYNTSLSPRQSELAILVTARACNSPFEWYAHRLEAEKARLQHRSELLDPSHTDPDLAEEMIRNQLGYVRPDEIIIPLDDSTQARPAAQRP